MKGLFDPDGRKRVAAVVVWGSRPQSFNRAQIERRIERLLEKISHKVVVKNGTTREKDSPISAR